MQSEPGNEDELGLDGQGAKSPAAPAPSASTQPHEGHTDGMEEDELAEQVERVVALLHKLETLYEQSATKLVPEKPDLRIGTPVEEGGTDDQDSTMTTDAAAPSGLAGLLPPAIAAERGKLLTADVPPWALPPPIPNEPTEEAHTQRPLPDLLVRQRGSADEQPSDEGRSRGRAYPFAAAAAGVLGLAAAGAFLLPGEMRQKWSLVLSGQVRSALSVTDNLPPATAPSPKPSSAATSPAAKPKFPAQQENVAAPRSEGASPPTQYDPRQERALRDPAVGGVPAPRLAQRNNADLGEGDRDEPSTPLGRAGNHAPVGGSGATPASPTAPSAEAQPPGGDTAHSAPSGSASTAPQVPAGVPPATAGDAVAGPVAAPAPSVEPVPATCDDVVIEGDQRTVRLALTDETRAASDLTINVSERAYQAHFSEAGELNFEAPRLDDPTVVRWLGAGGELCQKAVATGLTSAQLHVALVWSGEHPLELSVIEPHSWPGNPVGDISIRQPNLDGEHGAGSMRSFGTGTGLTRAQLYSVPLDEARKNSLFDVQVRLAPRPSTGGTCGAVAGVFTSGGEVRYDIYILRDDPGIGRRREQKSFAFMLPPCGASAGANQRVERMSVRF